MRPILALLVAALILGCVASYAVFVRTLPALEANSSELIPAPGEYTVDLTLTFDAQPDSFSLEPTSVLLQLADFQISLEQAIRAGQPVELKVPNLKLGSNDIYIEVHSAEATLASSPSGSTTGFSLEPEQALGATDQFYLPARAVRVRVLRDGVPIHEQTIWSEPGQPVRGTVKLHVTPPDEGDHAH